MQWDMCAIVNAIPIGTNNRIVSVLLGSYGALLKVETTKE